MSEETSDKMGAESKSALNDGSQLDPEFERWILSLKEMCQFQQRKQTHIQLTWPKRRGPKPPHFPRGEFVAEYDRVNAYAYDCQKVIDWCDDVLSLANVKHEAECDE